MTPKKQIDVEKVYTGLMVELKARVTAIAVAGAGHMRMPSPFVREFCYLQIRMMCELIALGCLVAHGDIADLDNKTVQREWSARKIIAKLTALHPEFFPLAASLEMEGERLKRLTVVRDGIMTKDELLSLHSNCDPNLHRGSLKKLLTQKRPAKLDVEDIQKMVRRIVGLLQSHMLVTRGDKKAIICNLTSLGGRAVAVWVIDAR